MTNTALRVGRNGEALEYHAAFDVVSGDQIVATKCCPDVAFLSKYHLHLSMHVDPKQ
ncbi:MAG: hypothetical protein ABJK93_21440 [Paracoccaceae bacterium]